MRIWTIKGYDNKLEKNRRNINYDSGRKIKQLRNENGLSQEKFAEKLNVSRSAVAKWETDGRLS